MGSRKGYRGMDMPEIYYTSTDPVFGKMTIKQFIDIEVKERGNYTLAGVQNWMRKYGLSMNDLSIWVSPKKWVANRYNLLAEGWDEAEKIPESEMNVYEIKGTEGFIIPESDDGDEGYLFVFKKNLNPVIRESVNQGTGTARFDSYLNTVSPMKAGMTRKVMAQLIRLSDGTIISRREWIEKKASSGGKIGASKTRLRNKEEELERQIEIMKRDVPANENHPTYKRYMEMVSELKKGIFKEELHIEMPDGKMNTVIKTEADYFNFLQGLSGDFSLKKAQELIGEGTQGTAPGQHERITKVIEDAKKKPYSAPEKRNEIRAGLTALAGSIDHSAITELRSFRPMGMMSEFGAAMGAEPRKGVRIDTPYGPYVFDEKRIPSKERVDRWGDLHKEAEAIRTLAIHYTFGIEARPNTVTGNFRVVERGRKFKEEGLISPEEEQTLNALEKYWQDHPDFDREKGYGIWGHNLDLMVPEGLRKNMTEKKGSLIDALLKIEPGKDIRIDYNDVPKGVDMVSLPPNLRGIVIERRGAFLVAAIQSDRDIVAYLYVQKGSQLIQIRPVPRQKTPTKEGEVNTIEYNMWVERIKKEAPEYLPEWEITTAGIRAGDTIIHKTAKYTAVVEKVYKNGNADITVTEAKGIPEWEKSIKEGFPIKTTVKGTDIDRYFEKAAIKGTEAKQPWQMTRSEAIAGGTPARHILIITEPEEYYFGTQVEIMQGVDPDLEPYFTGTVKRLLNNREVVEVHPEGDPREVSVRVPVDRVNVTRLVTQEGTEPKKLKTLYRYYFRNRPPSIGTHPYGAVETEAWLPMRKTPKGNMALGWVSYERELTPEEIKSYELFVDESVMPKLVAELIKFTHDEGIFEGFKELKSKTGWSEYGLAFRDWLKANNEWKPDKGEEAEFLRHLARLTGKTPPETKLEDQEKANLFLSALPRFTLDELIQQEATVRRWSIRFPDMEKELEDEYKTYIELRRAEKDTAEAARKEKASKPQSEQAKELYKQMRKTNSVRELDDWRNKVLFEAHLPDVEEDILLRDLAANWRIYLETRGIPALNAFDKLPLDYTNEDYYFGTEVYVHPTTGIFEDQPYKGIIHEARNGGELWEVARAGSETEGTSRVPIERLYVTKIVEKPEPRYQPPIKAVTSTERPAFNPEQAIKIAADSIETLRRVDVFRVLNEYSNKSKELGDYIKSKRPDLVAEVDKILGVSQPKDKFAGIQDQMQRDKDIIGTEYLRERAWQMTSKEFINEDLRLNRYREKYEKDPKLMNGFTSSGIQKWKELVEKHGEVGKLPDKVIEDYIQLFGEQALFSVFRGMKAKGIEGWRIPAVPPATPPAETPDQLYAKLFSGWNAQSKGAQAKVSDKDMIYFISTELKIPPEQASKLSWIFTQKLQDDYNEAMSKEKAEKEIKKAEEEKQAKVNELKFWDEVKNLKVMDFEVQHDINPDKPTRTYYHVYDRTFAILENGKKVQVSYVINKGVEGQRAAKATKEFYMTFYGQYMGKPLSEWITYDQLMNSNRYEDYKAQQPKPRFTFIPEALPAAPLAEQPYVPHVGDMVRVIKTWSDLTTGDVLEVVEVNELLDAQLIKKISPRETVKYGGTRATNLILVKRAEMAEKPREAPAVPPVAKPVQSIQEIQQQVLSSIQAAISVEELQPVMKGIGFLPLPESEKRQVMDAYQNRYSILMSERPFGVPVKGEEKPKAIGAPTPQQLFEAEMRRKATESRTVSVTPTLTGGAVTSRKLEMFEPGAMEKAKAEVEVRTRIEQLGLPYEVHPVIRKLAAGTQDVMKFGAKRGRETVDDLVLARYVKYCPPGTIIDNRSMPKVPERWWVYPPKLRACMGDIEKKLAEAGAGMVREATQLTSSMRSYIRGAVAIRDVIHYYRDGRTPTRGVAYRARDGTYFVEAQDGQVYSSMGWEEVSIACMPPAGRASA